MFFLNIVLLLNKQWVFFVVQILECYIIDILLYFRIKATIINSNNENLLLVLKEITFSLVKY